MVFAPIRGIFLLGRTAFIVAAAAAVPILLKKNRKLADQVGDTLMKAGEKLKKGYGTEEEASTAAPGSSTSQTPKAEAAKATKPRTAKTRVQSSKKKPAKPASGSAATAARPTVKARATSKSASRPKPNAS